jgi:hypothetical protein
MLGEFAGSPAAFGVGPEEFRDPFPAAVWGPVSVPVVS